MLIFGNLTVWANIYDEHGDNGDDVVVKYRLDWLRCLFQNTRPLVFLLQIPSSFKLKFLSSNFLEIILSCAYRASGMQQLRQGGPT